MAIKEKNIGVPLKKGQLTEWEDGIFRVEQDVEWNEDFDCWGSVWLENVYPPRFTDKGGFKVISPS